MGLVRTAVHLYVASNIVTDPCRKTGLTKGSITLEMRLMLNPTCHTIVRLMSLVIFVRSQSDHGQAQPSFGGAPLTLH